MTFYRLFYPRQTCFLVASHEGKPNVTVVDWLMPVSLKPPMVAVALNNNSQSLELLSHSKEFTLCAMPEKSKETAALIGATTGRLIDKVDEYNIALVKSRRLDAPLLKEALGSVECKVVQISSAGDHSLVLGEVVETHYPEGDDESVNPLLFNWGNKNYFGLAVSGSKEAFKDNRKKEAPPTLLEQAKEMKDSRDKDATDAKDKEQKDTDAKNAKDKEQKDSDAKEAKDKEHKDAKEAKEREQKDKAPLQLPAPREQKDKDKPEEKSGKQEKPDDKEKPNKP